MPVKSLPSAPSLEHLKYQAKDLLKALRERNTQGIALLREFHPSFAGRTEQEMRSIRFALSDAQLIVAREYGFDSWPKLKRHLESRGGANAQPAVEAAAGSVRGTRAERVPQFLEYACPDHHIRGGIAHIMARNTAMRLLRLDPGIASENLYTACVCGEVDVVERILSERPAAASEAYSAPGPDRSGSGSSDDVLLELGPKRWEPLFYVCFARVPIPAAQENAVAIARSLLERGANPNVYFMAGGSRYTPLVGVIGEGEENRLPHPQRDALTRLLLEHGAEPFDIQVIYNTHFQGKLLWFLRLIYDASVKAGRKEAWDDPDWSMLNMGGYGSGARFLFWVAIQHNDLTLAEWMLQHGANPNAAPPAAQTLPQDSLYDYALRSGHPEMTALLARYGANRSSGTAVSEDLFTSACFRLDRAEAQRLALERPDYLLSPRALMEAARADRPDVVRLLLGLGMSPNILDPKEGNQHALHVAAYSDAAAVAELLIERGAEVDYRESNYQATALGFAIYGERWRAIEVLSRHTADVWMLTFLGKVERIRELLAANPELAKIVSADGETPLMRLPDDEEAALEVVRLFLRYGADPTLRNQQGQTAADSARKRHLDRAAVALTAALEPTKGTTSRPTLHHYEEIAEALVHAFSTGDQASMQRVWTHFGHRRTWEAMRRYVLLDLGKTSDDGNDPADITLDEARLLVARALSFRSWEELAEYLARIPDGPGTITARPVALFTLGPKRSHRKVLRSRDWDRILRGVAEARAPGLRANRQMTDAMLAELSQHDHLASLDLNGCEDVTDAGARLLAGLPRLQHLDLSGTGITDRGLEALANLKDLKTIKLARTRVSDAGVAHLKGCEQVERVILSGTQTGDGAIQALAGKRHLHFFMSGARVTDSGIPLLHDFPVFKIWQGGKATMALLDYEAGPNYLGLRGTFTDGGFAKLAGLDGLFALNVEDSKVAVTAQGLAAIVDLPNLGWLAFDANDDSMPVIASMPKLRFLMCQDTATGNDGFAALARSQSIEYIWGRRCYNLGTRGFQALAKMPRLRGLSVSCKNVGDEGLAALPSFPSLQELMPMDAPDEGYRHIGLCQRVESLVLMYCRDTSDVATEHIVNLSKLKKYFASYTKITDRSMQLLSNIRSLEDISFYGCPAVTDAGVVMLARLPRLRRLEATGQQITSACQAAFSARVKTRFTEDSDE